MVDVSSYNLPTRAPLDTMVKYQQAEQNQINIDKSKLDLVNQKWGIINKELSTMAGDPNINEQDVFKRMQGLLNQGLIDDNQYGQFIKQIPSDKTQIPRFIQTTLERGQDNVTALNWHYGQQSNFDNGQTVTPGVTSTKPGFAGDPTRGGFKPTSAPIQKQLPVGAEGRDNRPTLPDGTPNPNFGAASYLGPQLPQNAPGTVSQPTPINTSPLPVGPVRSPALKGQSSNFGGNVLGAAVEAPTPAQSVSDRFPNVPRGPATGMPPMFEEGKKQLVEDQNLSTAKLTAIKPAIQALPLIEGLKTGLGTDTYNKALAGLSNLGLLPQGMTDRVAAYQELNKKLAQYVSTSPVAARSDAAQTLAEASSPSPKTQINPALIKLTKDAIILDRVQAARAGAFEGNDYSKYGEHRSTFPAKVDERAFGLDLMKSDERKALLKEMYEKRNTFEGKKFRRSLEYVDKQGLIDTGSQ